MSESLQGAKHEVQQSGDTETTIPISDNGCIPDCGQIEQKTDSSNEPELLVDTNQDCCKSVEDEGRASATIPEQECQQPVVQDTHSSVKTCESETSLNPTPQPTDEPIANAAPVVPEATSIRDKPGETVEAEKKKDDNKLGIYKALAIKLKKELVKTRDELAKLKQEYQSEIEKLREQVTDLEQTLESERITSTNTTATLEASVKNLRNQLTTAENDMQTLQIDFDNYKTNATKILQKSQTVQSNSNRSFEEDRYKQLKSLSEE